jgi:MFS transporter, ACS family, hexuronate transporter
LLLFGTTNNYMDRQILGVLKTTLQLEFGWNEIDYGNLVFAFQMAYAIGIVLMGRLMDRLGTRIGYAFAVVFWSLAAVATAFCNSLSAFAAARFALGLGESGVFPASIKAVAEWFPKRERALATGIFNAGTNVGAVITPLVVPWITLTLGWRWAFVLTGSVGFVWLIFWRLWYRRPEEHPRLRQAELDLIRSDLPESTAPVKWLRLLPHRQTWAFVMGKFMIDPIWWFFLFWAPDFLQRKFGLGLGQIGLPVMAIYLIADVGSVGGGWLSSALIKRGATVNRGRKIAMLVCALCVMPIAITNHVGGLWTAVLLIGLAAAAHQGFSANLFTLTSDMFPTRAVGSVVGIGGMAGAIGGMLSAKIVAYLLQTTGSYTVPFVFAAATYISALLVIHLLVPRLEPATVQS